MNEDEFDSLMKSRPFTSKDAERWDAEVRCNMKLVATLGSALWGTTAEFMQRQLLASHPELPSGFELAEFRQLLRWTAQMNHAVSFAQKIRGLSPAVLSAPAVFIGSQSLTLWEARYEIVRRAVEFLESR